MVFLSRPEFDCFSHRLVSRSRVAFLLMILHRNNNSQTVALFPTESLRLRVNQTIGTDLEQTSQASHSERSGGFAERSRRTPRMLPRDVRGVLRLCSAQNDPM